MKWSCSEIILSVGNYASVKRSGFSQWAKLNCHVHPCMDNGTVVTAIEQTVEFWPSDSAVSELVAIATSKGTEIPKDGATYKRFKLVGDAIPDQYRDMFSFMGEIRWDYISFGSPRAKVDRNDKPVKSDGKPIVADGFTLAYWQGPMISSGLTLSREWRLARAMKEWKSIPNVILDIEENNEKQQNGENSSLGGES